ERSPYCSDGILALLLKDVARKVVRTRCGWPLWAHGTSVDTLQRLALPSRQPFVVAAVGSVYVREEVLGVFPDMLLVPSVVVEGLDPGQVVGQIVSQDLCEVLEILLAEEIHEKRTSERLAEAGAQNPYG